MRTGKIHGDGVDMGSTIYLTLSLFNACIVHDVKRHRCPDAADLAVCH